MLRRMSTFRDLDEISAGPDCPSIDPSSVPKILYGRKSSLHDVGFIDSGIESRVLIMYTGGTIGMVSNERGTLAPLPQALESRIRLYPHMHDAAYAAEHFSNTPNQPLILPYCGDRCRVAYWVYEYNPLLDSSNMTMDDWIRIAMDIQNVYDQFDGFVILHGTDTLAYTASALSFMFENLGKPIVVTGSQIPIFETRSDGRDNFIGSVILASSYDIPEVTVYFNNNLYRGNRTVKVSAGNLAAFGSPNMSPLAVAGISIQVESRLIFRHASMARFDVMGKLNRHVALLRIFPSISVETVRSFVQPPICGVVVQTYGAGNIPSNRDDFVEVLRHANSRGVIILNITQCAQGSVQALYETGEILKDAGVLPGHDMTPEAAVTKLSYVLAKDEWDLETKKKMIVKNLRGELTSLNEDEQSATSSGIIETVIRALQLSTISEKDQVEQLVVPTLFFEAVTNSDIGRMESLWPHFTDINKSDVNGSTALHIATREGHEHVVKWLLNKGSSVHSKNSDGHTPLWMAVEKNHHKVINALVQTGAHLTEGPLILGQSFVFAGSTGNLQKLRSYYMAGCDLNQSDSLGRTALHASCIGGFPKCVQFLLSCDVDTTKRDKTNLTPADCAEMNEFKFLVELLSEHTRLKATKLLQIGRQARKLSTKVLPQMHV